MSLSPRRPLSQELLTIGGGVLFFSEAFDALNAVGFATCQVGVLAYAWLRTEGAAKGPGTGYAPVSATAAEAGQAIGSVE